MYCPSCGGSIFDALFGGACQKGCVYCGKGINCCELFSEEIDEKSKTIRNPFKAIWLRYLYNRKPWKKEEGKKRVEENKKFYKKMAEEGHRHKQFMENLENYMRNPPPINIRKMKEHKK